MSGKKKGNGAQRAQQNQPQKQTKSEKQQPALIGRKLRTSTGFEYTLEAKNLQDMRFLDALVSMEDQSLPEAERITNMVRLIRMMLGESQKEAFYSHITRIYGWASPAAVGKELQDIIGNFDEGKKK